MLFTKGSVVLGLVAITQALSIRDRSALPRGSRVLKRQANPTCLEANAVQTGSNDNGQDPPVDGQSNSATSEANFINFCSGETVTNGLQVQGGSCNGIPMGKIPSNQNMVSSIIVSPKPGEDIAAGQTFTMSVQVQNLVAGTFTNAQKTYYSAPQDLQGGKIVGHTHLTVQDLGNNLEPTQPPNPAVFAFFKGINDNGNGNGLLSATVTGGLPAGNYRVCSMTSASNHQPVLMPVAQRGAQDDCQKFTVGAGGGGGGNNNAGANGGAGAGAGNGGADAGAGNGGADAGAGGNNNAGGNAGGADAAAGNGGAGAGAGGNNNAGGNAGGADAAAGNGGADAGAGGNNNAGGNAGGNGGGAGNGGANAAAVGGIAAPAVEDSGDAARPFKVDGNTFVNEGAAKQRSCDIQRNGCLNAVNGGAKDFTAQQCEAQTTTCLA